MKTFLWAIGITAGVIALIATAPVVLFALIIFVAAVSVIDDIRKGLY